jgi:hypothetical protein
VASGGETTISGADANGAVLAYTAGLEQVVLNGAVLVRGFDYTATTGTTITGLSPALVASDVLEVFSFIAFSVANTYTQSQVDGLLADYAGLRLLVPTSAVNGTVGTSGAVTFSGISSVSLNGCFSSAYENYLIVGNKCFTSVNATDIKLNFRASGVDNSNAQYSYGRNFTDSSSSGFSSGGGSTTGNATFGVAAHLGTSQTGFNVNVFNPFISSSPTSTFGTGISLAAYGYMTSQYTTQKENLSFDGFTLTPSSGTFTGTIRVYGYKN